jgi:hypothetical protein
MPVTECPQLSRSPTSTLLRAGTSASWDAPPMRSQWTAWRSGTSAGAARSSWSRTPTARGDPC